MRVIIKYALFTTTTLTRTHGIKIGQMPRTTLDEMNTVYLLATTTVYHTTNYTHITTFIIQ